MSSGSAATETIADALFAAWRDHAPLTSLPPWLADSDADGAYTVQDALHERFLAHGRRQVGWKVGVTSSAALAAMGAREPMAGAIYADSVLSSGDRFDPVRGCEPRLEGELLIELSDRAAEIELHGGGPAAAVMSVRPAFEIADSRFAGWASSIAPAIADNACFGWLVAGRDGHEPAGFDDSGVTMTMTLDGRPVSQGRGEDCLGGAFNVVRWFLAHARSRGLTVRGGQWLLTGAMGPAVASPPSATAQVTLSGLGTVELKIGGA